MSKKQRSKQILEGVSRKNPADEFMYGLFLLQSETSLTFQDIFGEEVVYTVREEVSRGSWVKDLWFGKKVVESPRYTRTLGMRAQKLQAYMDSLKHYNKRKEHHHKKAKMRSGMKGGKM